MSSLSPREDEQWTSILRPRSPWFRLELKELWKHKDLILIFVKRDFVAIYKQSILGPFWYLIQPILSTIIFSFVFGTIAQISTDGAPHTLFYMSGIVAWNFFASCLNRTSDTFVSNAALFGKVYFPRLAVPVAMIILTFLTFAIQFSLFLVTLFVFVLKGSVIHPNKWILLTPLLLLQMGALGLGLGILISSLTAKYRDLTYVLGFGVQLWMYITPVVYPLSKVPEKLIWLYALNPMSGVVETFRHAFLGTGSIRWMQLGVSACVTVIILLSGIVIFSRVEKTVVDTV